MNNVYRLMTRRNSSGLWIRSWESHSHQWLTHHPWNCISHLKINRNIIPLRKEPKDLTQEEIFKFHHQWYFLQKFTPLTSFFRSDPRLDGITFQPWRVCCQLACNNCPPFDGICAGITLVNTPHGQKYVFWALGSIFGGTGPSQHDPCQIKYHCQPLLDSLFPAHFIPNIFLKRCQSCFVNVVEARYIFFSAAHHYPCQRCPGEEKI